MNGESNLARLQQVRGGDRPLDDLVGEWVLIHVGFAMAVIDADEAAETLEALRGLGEAQETLEQMAESAKSLEAIQ